MGRVEDRQNENALYLEESGLYGYNTDFILRGNELQVRTYWHTEKDATGKGTDLKMQFAGYSTKEQDAKVLDPQKVNDVYTVFHPLVALPYRSWKWSIVEWLRDQQYKAWDRVAENIDRNNAETFEKSLKRAFQGIHELIACNAGKWAYNGEKEYMKFVTLTFHEEVRDIKEANEELTAFMKRLSYYHTKKRVNVFKYLAIPELQARGVWHYHIVFFNLPYTYWEDLQELWGNGFIGINIVKSDDPTHVANYVGKYLTKGVEVKGGKAKIKGNKGDNKKEGLKNLSDFELYKALGLQNMKRYSASKGLYRQKRYRLTMPKWLVRDLLEYIRDRKNNKKVKWDGAREKKYSYHRKYAVEGNRQANEQEHKTNINLHIFRLQDHAIEYIKETLTRFYLNTKPERKTQITHRIFGKDRVNVNTGEMKEIQRDGIRDYEKEFKRMDTLNRLELWQGLQGIPC